TLRDFAYDELHGKGVDKSIVTVPDIEPFEIPLSDMMDWTEDDSLAASMATLYKLSGSKCRVRMNTGEGTVLAYENFLPLKLAPLLILDASGRHRSIYEQWFEGRGDLRYLHSPQRTIRNLTIHFCDAPSGRGVFHPKIIKRYRNWNWKDIVRESAKVLRETTAKSLVIHTKPRPEFIIDVQEELKRLGDFPNASFL